MLDTETSFDGLVEARKIQLDSEMIASWLKGRVVMVTGAGGAVGSALSRQLIEHNPATIILLDRSEQALSRIQQLLKYQLEALNIKNRIKLVPVLGSVSDSHLTEHVLNRNTVNIVFHAAADNQVVMQERNVVAAIQNNIFAAASMARAAEKTGVRDFVLISTNKAGNPVNVLGATKRLAEQFLQSLSHNNTGTRFSVVRFGNVMGASGSVLPRFQQQILSGGPVTVTHPEVRRSFIRAADAARLIMQAGTIARGGEVFSLNMPNPIRIADMARRLIKQMGHTLCAESDSNQCSCNNAVHILYTGLRNGESLNEHEPCHNKAVPTSHPEISRLHVSEYGETALSMIMKQLKQACTLMDNDLARDLLTQSVAGMNQESNIKSLPQVKSAVAGGRHSAAGKPVAASNS